MRQRWLKGLVAGLLTVVWAMPAALAAEAPGAAASADAAATRQLHALFDARWEALMQTYPEWATFVGDHRYGDRLHDASPAAIAAGKRAVRQCMICPTKSSLRGFHTKVTSPPTTKPTMVADIA